jgi:hypothetical protein
MSAGREDGTRGGRLGRAGLCRPTVLIQRTLSLLPGVDRGVARVLGPIDFGVVMSEAGTCR